jgi:hypothetical protein
MSVRGECGFMKLMKKYRVALIRVPFYFINLLPTSLLYISILLENRQLGMLSLAP